VGGRFDFGCHGEDLPALRGHATAVDRGSFARLATRPVTSSSLDIVAIGDAIVDVIATCDDAFLESRRFAKG